MAASKQTDGQTYTPSLHCSPTSVGLAQAQPRFMIHHILWLKLITIQSTQKKKQKKNKNITFVKLSCIRNKTIECSMGILGRAKIALLASWLDVQNSKK